MKQIVSFDKEIPFKTMIGEISSISLEHTLKFKDDSSILGDFIVSGTYKLTEASRLDEPFSYKIPVDITLTSALEDDRHVEIEDFTYEIIDEEVLLVKIDLLIEGVEKIEEDEDFWKEDTNKRENLIKEEEEKEEELEGKHISKDQEEVIEQLEEELPLDEKIVREPLFETEIAPLLKEETVLEAKENIDKMKQETSLVENLIEDQEEVLKEEPPQEDALPENSLTTPVLQEEVSAPKKEVINSIFSVFKDTEETFSTYSVYILREEDTLDEVLNRYGVSREEAQKYNTLEDLKVGSKLILPTVISNE